jgi:hypothetical protein
MILNLEDCLEHLAGLRESPVTFTIEKTDYTIITSIAKQCFKGTALTDRQSALMQEKLQTYRDQFINLDWDFDYAVEQLRQPLRHIDRSKYIKLQDNNIVVRFPFNKTDICYVQEFSSTADGYHHQNGTHMHSFDYTERNVLNLLDRFTKKEFTIDEELLEIYNKVKVINDNPQDYLSGILDTELVNIHSNLMPVIKDEVGDFTSENMLQFVDRRFRYGFNYINLPTDQSTLVNQIVCRKNKQFQSRPSMHSLHNILDALWKLDRFPLLVVLDNEPENQLHELANHFRDILNPEEQSVLFRLEDKDAGFNQLIKDRKLNNWVDSTTKVVYISKNKLPKLLVKNEWKPSAVFSFSSSMDRFVNSYVSFNCDLIVYREEHLSPMRRHSRYYA